MRLSRSDIDHIRQQVLDIAGPEARVRLFGSRVDDAARGGDVDLLVELPEPVDRPAQLSVMLSTGISRALLGRAVDVVLMAPNLQVLPIHQHARTQGILL